ncbi:MAG: hypothetical protein GF317_09365 [Candidatus Lokiarchaeota archaeon]|nr:hypothetical protein [Candidatus Lokiarchaeota archaeon]MBD3199920.1 hypothetical protein [Candidatus Lokiarchaeota archaeon]
MIMSFFFELLKNRIGFSRIGRITLTENAKDPFYTPNNIIPINKPMMENLDFIENCGQHEVFVIKDEIYLKDEFIHEMFKDSGFLYLHTGAFKKYSIILENKKKIFENDNVISILPFNIPTTIINKEFFYDELHNYFELSSNILNKFPHLNFGITIKLFEYPELIEEYVKFIKDHENICLLNLADLFDNFVYFRTIIKTLITIKNELDNNLVLMASGRLLTNFYPLLVYLGIDLIDSSYLIYMASENFYDSIEDIIPIYKMRFLPCNCVVCRKKLNKELEEKNSIEKMNYLCYHNLISATNYMRKTIQYLHTEDFRNFVEKSAFNDTYFISLLKILDNYHYNEIECYSKMIQKNKEINSLGPSSHNRPDFKRFRKKVVETFQPESWTKLIVLFPCSAKKPYSESRSHQRFYSILRKYSDFPMFQEIILTSPLGAIPRQLENIYPVNCYDISVTGEWSFEELRIASDMLISLLKKFNPHIPIICHLDGGYREISKIAEKEVENPFYYSELTENLTNYSSLNNLQQLIDQRKDEYSLKEDSENEIYTKTWTRKFSKILDYQFGSGFSKDIIGEGIYYAKDKFNTKLTIFDSKQKVKLGSFKFDTGKIRLTIQGAERIAFKSDFSKYLVFDGDKIRGNTLFRPGIINFNSDLLPDENVCIFNRSKDKIVAMGDMIVGSQFIKNSSSGKVVKLYETR